ncbi:MAG: hypothetical protein ACFFG0_18565 [Candidatus Thorarchaeota archaeon]
MKEAKICTKCKRKLPLSEFSKDKSKKDDLTSHCKSCISYRDKEYYSKNRLHILKRQDKYREENREIVNARDLNYYYKNKERCNRKMKEYHKKFKEKTGFDRILLHRIIRNNKEKPFHCEKCKKKTERLELALIGKEYTLDPMDYEYLCHKCHLRMDLRIW